jgi:threonine/homoserine/homoserine lactone efflux protein
VNYLSLIVFVVATCGAPGPNNVMIMSSGTTYGLRRSLDHAIGINVGFPLMTIAIGLGLGEVLREWPGVYDVLRPIGAAYLIYLAYRIAMTRVSAESVADRRPLTLLQGAFFQLISPKSWVMIIGAIGTYATANGDNFTQTLIISLIFLVFGTPCTLAWLAAGVLLKGAVSRPRRLRAFNVGMASLLMLTLIPVFAEILKENVVS